MSLQVSNELNNFLSTISPDDKRKTDDWKITEKLSMIFFLFHLCISFI